MGKSKRGIKNGGERIEDGSKKVTVVPGPGQYPPINPSKLKSVIPSWTMGTSKREGAASKSKHFPGPGTYDIKLLVRIYIRIR